MMEMKKELEQIANAVAEPNSAILKFHDLKILNKLKNYASKGLFSKLFRMTGALNEKAAYTMSEVIIVMGIIGIIALLIIAFVIGVGNDKRLVSQTLKMANTLTNAFKNAEVLDKLTQANDVNDFTAIFDKHLRVLDKDPSKFVRYMQKVGLNGADANNFRTLNDGSIIYYNTQQFNAGCGYMENGPYESGMASSLKYPCMQLYVDVNGFKAPNKPGKDLYSFFITKYGVVGYGHIDGGSGLDCAMYVVANHKLCDMDVEHPDDDDDDSITVTCSNDSTKVCKLRRTRTSKEVTDCNFDLNCQPGIHCSDEGDLSTCVVDCSCGEGPYPYEPGGGDDDDDDDDDYGGGYDDYDDDDDDDDDYCILYPDDETCNEYVIPIYNICQTVEDENGNDLGFQSCGESTELFEACDYSDNANFCEDEICLSNGDCIQYECDAYGSCTQIGSNKYVFLCYGFNSKTKSWNKLIHQSKHPILCHVYIRAKHSSLTQEEESVCESKSKCCHCAKDTACWEQCRGIIYMEHVEYNPTSLSNIEEDLWGENREQYLAILKHIYDDLKKAEDDYNDAVDYENELQAQYDTNCTNNNTSGACSKLLDDLNAAYAESDSLFDNIYATRINWDNRQNSTGYNICGMSYETTQNFYDCGNYETLYDLATAIDNQKYFLRSIYDDINLSYNSLINDLQNYTDYISNAEHTSVMEENQTTIDGQISEIDIEIESLGSIQDLYDDFLNNVCPKTYSSGYGKTYNSYCKTYLSNLLQNH